MNPTPNVIEIQVKATNLTGATFDEVRAKARTIGEGVGSDFSKGLGDQVIQDAPVWGAAVGETAGQRAGFDFTEAFGGRTRGQESGSSFTDGLGEQVKKDLPTKVEKPLQDSGRTGGEKAGQAAAGGISPLIVGAFTAAATIGPQVLVAATAGAVAGAAALVLKSNQVIAADYHKLGQDVTSTLQSAVAPITGDMHVALGQLDTDIVQLEPKLQSLFTAVAPDLTSLTSGVSSFVGGALPGMTSALSGSQVIVTDFANSLGSLGSGVGSFFNNMVHDASAQGAAIQDVVGVLGHTFSTLGTVIGSASADASSALMALTPALNGVLTVVSKISNPAVIGGGAGLFAAFKLDPSIQSGLLSGAEGLSKVADKAQEAGGVAEKFTGFIGGASGALGKMAGVMGGPWGLAIGAGVGLATALGSALFEASHATDAVKVSADGLTQAIQQDGGKVGQSTTAYLAQQDSLNGVADTAAKAGVSLATLAQAAAGNKDAMASLTSSVDKSNLATRQQAAAQDDAARAAVGYISLNDQQNQVNDHAAAATNKLTDANQKLVNSVKAQAQQTADAINKQALLTQATNALNNSTNIFNATLTADYQAQVANAQQSADSKVAALNLGDAQYSLNQKLADSMVSYQMAQGGASAYKLALDAASGSADSLFGAQTSLDSAMQALTSSFKTNGYSIADNTAAGVANRQAISNVVTAAQNNAVALYQSEVNTKGATQAYTDANNTLAKSKAAFEAAAIAAGGNKKQVDALADSLFNLPQSVQTTVNVQANIDYAVKQVNSLMNYINSQTGFVTIGTGTGHGFGAQATGGPTSVSYAATGGPRQNLTWINEQGPELVHLPSGATVIPHADVDSMVASGKLGGGGASMGSGFELSVAQGSDGAVATMIMTLVRLGKLTIKQKAIVP